MSLGFAGSEVGAPGIRGLGLVLSPMHQLTSMPLMGVAETKALPMIS